MSEKESYYTTPGKNGRVPTNPAWEHVPYGADFLIYGSAAKAAAISLNRILYEGEGHVFRYTIQDGYSRLQMAKGLKLGPVIAWARTFNWPTPQHFHTVFHAISRNRLRVLTVWGAHADHAHAATIMLGRHALWLVNT